MKMRNRFTAILLCLLAVFAFSNVAMAQLNGPDTVKINCTSPDIYPGSGTSNVVFDIKVSIDNGSSNEINAFGIPLVIYGANIVSVDTTVGLAFAGSVAAGFNILSVGNVGDVGGDSVHMTYGAVTFATGQGAVVAGQYAHITVVVDDTGTICIDTMSAGALTWNAAFVDELAFAYQPEWPGNTCCPVSPYISAAPVVDCGGDREGFAGSTFNHNVTASDPDDPNDICDNIVSSEFTFLDSTLVPSAPVNTAPCGVASLLGPLGGSGVSQSFSWNTTGCPGGTYYVVFTYTDDCGVSGADTCKYVIKTACAFVEIGEVEADPGQTVDLPVYLTAFEDIGGFNFCIEFANTDLTAISVNRGNLIDDKDQTNKYIWHYFTYRLNPSTVIHKYKVCVVGIGRLYHYPGMCLPGNGIKDVLFTIKFVLANNQLLRCLATNVYFEWDDYTCLENTLTDCTGNELFVSDNPAYYNSADSACGLGEKNEITPCVNFDDGRVLFRCPEDVDPVVIGDINVNGSPYEIGDAVLFASYFIDGPGVFSNDYDTRQAQIGGSDINRDGFVLTVADLVYLLRILVGDQAALGEGTALGNSISADAKFDGRLVEITTPEALGAAVFVFKGEGKITPMQAGVDFKWKSANGETRVLVTLKKNGNDVSKIESGSLFSVKGDMELVSVEAATYGAQPIPVEVTGGLPKTYRLSQNFPNPFNATTQISFALPQAGEVTLKVYNVAGQLVRTFNQNFDQAGYKTITWDGTNSKGETVASGVYFYRLDAKDFSKTLKMTLLK